MAFLVTGPLTRPGAWYVFVQRGSAIGQARRLPAWGGSSVLVCVYVCSLMVAGQARCLFARAGSRCEGGWISEGRFFWRILRRQNVHGHEQSQQRVNQGEIGSRNEPKNEKKGRRCQPKRLCAVTALQLRL
eukprot:scaffold9293_cov20-Tisochrysis_lutea.AAC.2